MIANGQDADEDTFNNGFVSKTADSTTVGKINLNNADAASGSTVTNVQREINSLDSFTGRAAGSAKDVKPSWTNNDVGTSTDDLKTRVDLLTEQFNATTGHTHGGVGEGGPLALDMSDVVAGVLATANGGTGVASTATYPSSGTIVTEDAVETLTNKTINPANNTITLSSANILVGNGSNVATAVSPSGDVTINNSGVTTIGSNKVTNSMLAQVATQTFKGRTTASTGNVEDLTATQATAMLNTMVGDSGSGGTKGLVPAPAAGDAAAQKVLRADGTWVVQSSGFADPMTTRGDIIYRNSSNATTRLAAGSANTYLKSDGTDISWVAPVVPTVQKFTSGSGTYTTPAGVSWIRVRMVGGGGGGSGSATVAANNGGNGGAGGNTTFGTSLLVANGGGGGQSAAGSAVGGTGGTASLGTGPIGTALTGGIGGGYAGGGTSQRQSGGSGAASPFGGAAHGGPALAAGESAASNTGSGGAGAGSPTGGYNGTGGGAGGFVDAIIVSPAASYSYAVGSGGTAGTAGTSGYAGGTGGSGYIIVEEHYK